jgi:hypothetical protein
LKAQLDCETVAIPSFLISGNDLTDLGIWHFCIQDGNRLSLPVCDRRVKKEKDGIDVGKVIWFTSVIG